MRRAAAILSTVALALFSAELFSAELAAQNPDLSGSWTRIDDGSGGDAGGRAGRGGRGGRGGLGMSFTIAQTAETLTITRQGRGGEQSTVYNLDGSETTSTVQGRGGEQTVVAKAAWSEGHLTITTTTSAGDNQFVSTVVLSLDADGNLVVDATSPGRRGGDPTTTQTKYSKS